MPGIDSDKETRKMKMSLITIGSFKKTNLQIVKSQAFGKQRLAAFLRRYTSCIFHSDEFLCKSFSLV